MSMPILRLYDALGPGLVICCSSGVLVSNQTGGTSNLQPEVEGVYVPVRNSPVEDTDDYTPLENRLLGYFQGSKYRGGGATRGIDIADADFIDSLLKLFGLAPALTVDRTRLAESHEAWVHVVIAGNESDAAYLSLFADFEPYPRQGILTWENSD